jgi:S1-C subfamily serine protease
VRRLRTGLAALAAAGAVTALGCGGDDSSGTATRTVQTNTRVEVVKQSGGEGGFDPKGIYERESPGVVTILSRDFSGTGGGGLGSGFVVNGDGDVATNAHVVTTGTGRDIREAGEVYVRFPDGNQVGAKVVGFDPFSDVALLRVDSKGLTLRPLPLGDVGTVDVGEPVAAIGSPFGEESSLSVGVISATGRSIESLTGFETNGAIQTDAAINSGNSGGPLLDAQGRVIGINSQIRSSSGAGSGVGFAVPADVVRRSLDQLRRDGRVRYAYLGVSTRGIYPQLAQKLGIGTDHGSLVQSVVPGGPAEKAGLRAGGRRERFQGATWVAGGDVVTRLAGTELRKDTDLARALLRYQPGQAVQLEVVRDGRRRTVRVTLGTRPLESPQG